MGVWVAAGIGAISLLGGMAQGQEQAEGANASSIAEYNYNLMKETSQYGVSLAASARSLAMKQIQNSINYETITRNYARQQINLAKTATERRKVLSKSEKSKNSALTAMTTAKLGASGGTAEAIKRQMELQGKENWFNEFMNTANQKEALQAQYENNLNASQDMSESLPPVYLPGLPPQMHDVGRAAMWGAFNGGIQGLQLGASVMNASASYNRSSSQMNGDLVGGGVDYDQDTGSWD